MLGMEAWQIKGKRVVASLALIGSVLAAFARDLGVVAEDQHVTALALLGSAKRV